MIEIDSGPLTAPDVVTPNAGGTVVVAFHGDGDPPVSVDTPAAPLEKACVALADASDRPRCRASATEASSRAATAGRALRPRYTVWRMMPSVVSKCGRCAARSAGRTDRPDGMSDLHQAEE